MEEGVDVEADVQTFLQGGVDGTGAVTMRANQIWNSANTTKVQGQVRLIPSSQQRRLTCPVHGARGTGRGARCRRTFTALALRVMLSS